MTHKEEHTRETEAERTSRYILRNDPSADTRPLSLPAAWWSKPYEYEWAGRFAQPGDVVLDAGGGSVQPFILRLADRCRQVHVCDGSPHAESKESIIREWIVRYGPIAAVELQGPAFERLAFTNSEPDRMPFEDESFDSVFYLSSPEQDLNRLGIGSIQRRQHSDKREVGRPRLWSELARVLKPEGRLLVALIAAGPLDGLAAELAAAGLRFGGPVDWERSDHSLCAVRNGEKQYCFRACLVREQGSG